MDNVERTLKEIEHERLIKQLEKESKEIQNDEILQEIKQQNENNKHITPFDL